jgi:hypothetical protein
MTETASEPVPPVDQPPAIMEPGMRIRLLDRLVARAMPPNLPDPEQEHVAAEAAENAIRQVGRMAAVAGVVLLALSGALLYYSVAGLRAAALAQASRIAALEAESGAAREANATLRQQLDAAAKEAAGLRSETADLQARIAALTPSVEAVRAAQPKKAARVSKRRATSRRHIESSGTRPRPQPVPLRQP